MSDIKTGAEFFEKNMNGFDPSKLEGMLGTKLDDQVMKQIHEIAGRNNFVDPSELGAATTTLVKGGYLKESVLPGGGTNPNSVGGGRY